MAKIEMKLLSVAALILAAALAGCGQREGAEEKISPTAHLASEIPETPGATAAALRAQAGQYYADFIKAEGMSRYAVENLGLNPEAAARFASSMDVTAPSIVAEHDGLEALVFFGCAAHNCGGLTASVLAIDLATGDAFVGVKDEAGESILKSNARLQMLLTQTSPTRTWTDPVKG
ncbi:MAG: hypothetical protein AB7O04_05345 [Hyphomonadaceae bacterium]